MSPAVTYSRCQEKNVRVVEVYNDPTLSHSLSLHWLAAQGPLETLVFTLCLVVPCELVSWLSEVLQCPVVVSCTADLCSTCSVLHLLITRPLHWVATASDGGDSERSSLFAWYMMLMILYFCFTFLHHLCSGLKKLNLFAVWRNTQTRISMRGHS